MRFFRVTLGDGGDGRREIVVPAKTEVQAQDAAVTATKPGETILEVTETETDYQQADTLPPGTQTHPDQPV